MTGNGTFTASGTATTDVTSNASGVVSADYQASTLTSYGSDVIEITIGDVVSTITIPLLSGIADTLIVNADTSGVVGTAIRLEALVEDAQGNIVSGSNVTFQQVSGNGSFVGGASFRTVASGTDGYARAVYTLGTTLPAGNQDIVEVSIGGSFMQTITISISADSISYFTLADPAQLSQSAGSDFSLNLTAKDIYGNSVINSSQFVLSILGSSTAFFPIHNDTLQFLNSANRTITVQDTVTGSFRIKAQKLNNTDVIGLSNMLEVVAASPDSVNLLSASQNNVIIGNSININVKLQDQYGNGIADSTLKFKKIFGGTSGVFPSTNLDSANVTTDSDGLASALYRVSTNLAIGSDTVEVSYGSLTTAKIAVTLLADSIAYYTVVDKNNSYVYKAGQAFTIRVSAYDGFNNLASNSSRSVTLAAVNGSGVSINGGGNSAAVNLSSGVAEFTVIDTVKENNIRFRVSDSFGITDTTTSFFITAGDLSYLKILDGPDSSGTAQSGIDFTASTDTTLSYYAAGFDQYGNYRNDVTTAQWTSTNNLSPVVSNTGASLSYSPNVSGRSGRIKVNATSATGDSTGIITVGVGEIASVKITTDAAGTSVLSDLTLTAGNSTDLYAAAYDADNNFIRLVNADWDVVPDSIAALDAATGISVSLTADKVGVGTVRIDTSSFNFTSGIIRVNKGVAASIIVRSAANDGGTEIQYTIVNFDGYNSYILCRSL